MQLAMTRAIDIAATEPLLPASQMGGRASRTVDSGSGGPGSDSGSSTGAAKITSQLHFVRRFRALIRLLRPYPALILALLSVAEAVIVAEVGKVAGSFYLIVVDGQPSKFAAAMLKAAALYTASTACYAASSWVTERLALMWRRRLTHHLHARYCQRQHAFYFLQQPHRKSEGWEEAAAQQAQPGTAEQELQQRQQQQEPLPAHAQQSEAAGQGSREVESVDNADQRIAFDASELCESLSAVAKVAAAAPFKLVYYSCLTYGYLGWSGLVAVYLFFWMAALVQRLALAPVACLLFQQERREGDLRFAHLRLREYAAEVALYRGTDAERQHLNSTLSAALANQHLLVRSRAILAGTTRAVDYAGALLNYFCVAAAVFCGMPGAGGDSGRLAQFVSNASFATLALIYTFTELLDLSDKLSTLGGLTARVGQLLEQLPEDEAASSSSGDGGSGSAKGSGGWLPRSRGRHRRSDLHAVRLSMDGVRELRPSHLAAMLQPPRLMSCLGGSVVLEASTHLMGPDLQHEARCIFPDAPPTGQLLAVITFQFAAGGTSLAPDSSSATLERAAAEMDRLLDGFLRWEAAIRAALTAAGHWCDAVDPRSGAALHGTRGARWSEVAAAHALLGYERRDAGICPVVLHPQHGSSAYPVTFFTSAPAAELEAALAAVCDGAPSQVPPLSASTAAEPLLSLQQLSMRTPAGAVAVRELSLDVQPGQHLLIAGPNGCGKSTLMRALCGLHPLESGHVRLGGAAAAADYPRHSFAESSSPAGVMFVPQRPLAAPGGALWQQICYPGGSGDWGSDDESRAAGSGSMDEHQEVPSDAALLALLERVGLQYLLDRVGGSFRAAADWGAMLSPGELQRLAVARVLHRRPALAVLDEATSAVSEEAAAQLYGQLHAEGVTCISIAQDSSHLRRLHTRLLRLGCGPPDGSWRLEQLSQPSQHSCL